MSVKEIAEAMANGNVLFGIRQCLKFDSGKKGKNVFVAKDARDLTLLMLENEDIEYEVLGDKAEMAKGLGLDFESEVFLVK